MDSIPAYQKREELRRILHSRHFVRADKKARFLEFVTEETLKGNSSQLNEYLIGIEIYERGSQFNPQTDPIVRVQAHQIRRLLEKYYETDGKDSTLRLDLPPGHYVPVFRSVHEADSAGIPGPPVPRPAWRDPRNLLLLALAATCVFATVLWYEAVQKSRSEAVAKTPVRLSSHLQWFWQPFLASPRSPLVVIPVHPLLRAAHRGDSAKTASRGYLIPKQSLPEFRDTIHFRELDEFNFVPSTTDFTAVGETIGLVRLVSLFGKVNQTPDVKPSRLVDFQEIKSRNTILLGGNQAWSGRIFLYPEGFRFYQGVIWNKTPKPGELPVYKPEFDPVTNNLSRDYALILMLPNEAAKDRILLIYGIFTQGSQAAIEYVTTEEHLAELHRALIATSADKKTAPALFQALLETSVENSVPGRSRLVGVRTIPASGGSPPH
jgi:hypothetical protein